MDVMCALLAAPGPRALFEPREVGAQPLRKPSRIATGVAAEPRPDLPHPAAGHEELTRREQHDLVE